MLNNNYSVTWNIEMIIEEIKSLLNNFKKLLSLIFTMRVIGGLIELPTKLGVRTNCSRRQMT